MVGFCLFIHHLFGERVYYQAQTYTPTHALAHTNTHKHTPIHIQRHTKTDKKTQSHAYIHTQTNTHTDGQKYMYFIVVVDKPRL